MTRPPRRVLWLLAIAPLVLTGCGIRVSHNEVVRAAAGGVQQQYSGTDSPSAVGQPGTASNGDGSAPSATGGSATAGGLGGAGRPLTGGGTAPTGQGAGSSGQAGGAASPTGATGTPIRLGNVGEYSGAVGSSLSAAQPMLKVWAAWVNRHGGINGHPIILYTADSASDPSKARALSQQMVEQNHVVAFVGDMLPLTSRSVADYVDSVKIPVVGGDVSGPDWNTYPMLFPQSTANSALAKGNVYLLAHFIGEAGGNKWGMLYCVESGSCADGYNAQRTAAPKAGLDPVYGDQVSITQPTYTAQCLQAKSAGVNLLEIALDANSISRVARDCSAQGFNPLYASGSIIVTSAMAQDGGLDGLVASEGTFPWTYAGSPAAQEYQQAIKAINPSLDNSAAASAAWVAGKLLQAALAHVSRTAPITTADVLNGLYALHNETLGGLSPRLNFIRGRAAPLATCYFGIRIVKGKWVPLNNGAQYC